MVDITKPQDLFVIVDELRSRGATSITIGSFHVMFAPSIVAPEKPEPFVRTEQTLTPDELDLLLYNETSRL